MDPTINRGTMVMHSPMPTQINPLVVKTVSTKCVPDERPTLAKKRVMPTSRSMRLALMVV
ncbi:MAG: hypothetical protein BWY72_01257 [Bacteroidetes bacterium ADurb.Bin416]|nr:MAG: hypothetical protein BWY72_01257 [Bacteroidetes bacterium ADurb.Bin416]